MKRFTAKTVDDAVQLAAAEMNENVETLMYQVVEEKKGLFSKRAEIEVYELSDIIEFAEKYLKNAVQTLDIEIETKAVINDDIIRIQLNTGHNSILIGKNGRTLQALNELTKLAVSAKFRRKFRILLDINDYKDGKYSKIINIARREAYQVKKTKTSVTLDAMPADERRIVHNALNGMPNIKTESVGEGRRRQIVIKYIE